ncbi:hypothetical protein CD351_02310 [Erythrobacter sp. KY5]|nr:hypothetical protein CD351_02310 [Erythrobacter sp. KY5]
MIGVYVSADDAAKKPLVADHFEFHAVPRVGEEVVVDQDGSQFLLLVESVTNFAQTKGDIMNQVSPIHIKCALIHRLER